MSAANHIARLRRFNRFYTSVAGLLDEGFLNTSLTLSEARVIYEIGMLGTVTASDLGARLGMDRGQLSRMVQRFRGRGLVATARLDDGRAKPLGLTDLGQKIFQTLNQSSDAAACDVLAPLREDARIELLGAMRMIETLLGKSGRDRERPELVLRPHRLGELGWLIYRQALLYNAEFGWNAEFETLIARLYAEYAALPQTPPKALWIAELDDLVAGSLYVVPSGTKDTAQLRMLYVEPFARGHSIGRRLVDEAIRFAREANYARLILWTQDCLIHARKIYQAAGFELEGEERHHSFGKELNGQIWGRDL